MKQEFQWVDVLFGQTESLFILTNHILLKTGLWQLIQILHSQDYLFLQPDKLTVPLFLQKIRIHKIWISTAVCKAITG